MRLFAALPLFVALASLAHAQDAAKQVADQPSALSKDPQAVFAAAAPFYDFSNAALKPWHFKATYQLYDEKGNPGEQGTYEYWWASPQAYRSTWTRPSATRTYWHTANGKHAYQESGNHLNFAEQKLQSAIVSPLPRPEDLDPAKVEPQTRPYPAKGVDAPCFMLVPKMKIFGASFNVPLGLFETYCFDAKKPVLLVSFSMGSVAENFNKIVKMQDRYLPREIVFSEQGKKILSATVDSISGIAPSDPALTPPPDLALSSLGKVNVSGGVAQGMLLKKSIPVYPDDAKQARASGTVVLRATIGTDGRIHDLHVIQAPWPSMAQSALWAVSHWEYKPYFLNGEPVEVDTTVNVVFTLGG